MKDEAERKIERTNNVSTSSDDPIEQEIDEALVESFPASDPPAWTLGHDPHTHSQKEDKLKGASEESRPEKK